VKSLGWVAGRGRLGFAPPPLIGLILSAFFGALALLLVLNIASIRAVALGAPIALASVASYRLARLGAWVRSDGLLICDLFGSRLLPWAKLERAFRGPALVPSSESAWVAASDGTVARVGGSSVLRHVARAETQLDYLVETLNWEIAAHRSSGQK
jgi:hypothetical protein